MMKNYMLVSELIAEHDEWERFWCDPEDGYDSYQHVDHPNFKVTFADWNLSDGYPDLPHIRLDDDEQENENGYPLTLHKVYFGTSLDEKDVRLVVEQFFLDVDDILSQVSF